MSYKYKKMEFHGLKIASGSPEANASKMVQGRLGRKGMLISPKAKRKPSKSGHRRFLGFRAMEAMWTGQLAGGLGTGTGAGGGGGPIPEGLL